jgi:hypothetical protein
MMMMIIAPPAWAQGATTQVVGQHRAVITQVQGTVEVRTAGRSAWTAAARNLELKTGDRIRTAASSKCKVRISDVGEVELASSTEATVGDLQQVRTTARAFFMLQRTITRDDVGLDLRNGDMRSSFRRVEGRVGNYNVHTPVAVAGVRGTKFELDLEGGRPWYERLEEGKGQGAEQELTTIVLEGEVELIGPNWSRSVKGGEQLQSRSGQTPGQPGAADPNRLEAISGSFTPPPLNADEQAPTFTGASSMSRPSPISLQINWSAATDNASPADAILYDVYVANSKGGQDYSTPTVTSERGATSITLTGMDETKDYFVVVRARDLVGNRDQNTKEVTTSATSDVTAPVFNGATSAKKLTTTSVSVNWDQATDDRSAAEKIVYDVYLATSPGGQNFTAPTATSSPGATTMTLVNQPSGVDYYIVVRARDESGNRDENTTEAHAFAVFAAIAKATEELFTAYEQKNKGQFMAAIGTSFNGANTLGIKLNASTLSTSVDYDFSALRDAAYSPIINSVSQIGENKYQVDVTWSGRLRFQAVDTEQVMSGMRFKLIWEGEKMPLQLTQWEDKSPFGMSDPFSAVTVVQTSDEMALVIDGSTSQEQSVQEVIATDDFTTIITEAPAPTLDGISGFPTNVVINGDYKDLAPLRVTVTGKGFQSGATIMTRWETESYWEDLSTLNLSDVQTSIYYVSSTELWIDFARLLWQHMPSDVLSEKFYLYVRNPDGKVSPTMELQTTMTPGPLRLTGALTTDREMTTMPSVTPYYFSLEGYNLVTPLTVAILNSDGYTHPNFSVSNVNAMGTHDGMPIMLTFQCAVTGEISAGTYHVRLTDGRGQTASVPFTVNTASEVIWATSRTLTEDHIVPQGHTLTINAGVTVATSNGSRILVDGSLSASGATFSQVGIEFRSGSSGNLSNVTIQNVTTSPQCGLTVTGGMVTMSGGSVSGCQTGISVSDGQVSLSNVSLTSNSGVGIQHVAGGTLTLDGVMASGNGTGFLASGPVGPTVTGGTFSNNTNFGIQVDGGASLTIQTGTLLNGNNQHGLLVSSAGTVSIANATMSSNFYRGILMDNMASGAAVQLTSVTISGSPIGIEAQSGGITLISGNTVTGGSMAGVELSGAATLSTSGSNVIEGNGSSVAALRTAGTSTGNVTLDNGTTLRNATAGFSIQGSGAISILGASTVIQNNQNGINISGSSSNVSVGSGVRIQNNSNVGVMVGDAGIVQINGADILGNTSYGVARTSPSTLAGEVHLDNVRLNGNNGQGGSDLNTSPPTPDSDQYMYMTYTPNTVSNPRN